MAGGKETPRQKLISLMYLVLMAMLAMNVSAAILDKFFFLDQSLKHAVDAEYDATNGLIRSMEKKVEERGSKKNEVEALAVAKKLKQKAAELNAKVESLRDKLVEASGGRDEDTGKPSGMKDMESVAQVMLGAGDSKSGDGYKLKKDIEEYVKYLNSIYTDKRYYGKDSKPKPKLSSLTPDAKDDPLFKNDEDQKGKDWVQVNFEGTPVIAALASLSERESKIVEYEHEVLNVLARQVGAQDISFDEVVGMYRLKSSVVAAGTNLEGEVFVTAFSSTLTPKMTLNGAVLPVTDGMGKFKRKVSAKSYDKEGFSKQSYSASIALDDTTLKFKVDYTVSKPVIQIQSSSVQALYRNCGNELTVNVPALGSFYNPTFTLGSGEGIVKKNPKKKNEVVIIPSKRKVNLTVTNEGNKIGTETFSVRLVPKPEVQAIFKGKPVDLKKGITAASLRSIGLKVTPDPSFAQFLPKDAVYKITSWDAILVRGKRPVTKRTFSSSTGALNGFTARAGDRLLIEVKGLVRRTYTGGSEPIKLSGNSALINVPLN